MSDSQEIILCIPGPWQDRTAFIKGLFDAHKGRYLFAGVVLLDTETGDSVEVDLENHDPRMVEAFRPSGVGDETLSAIATHTLTAYLHFPLNLPDQRERLLKYSDILRKAGGVAVKLESCGLAHNWERWFEWLSSPFENIQYLAAVIIGVDNEGCYSCGMHHFGLPDSETKEPGDEGRSLLDAFNRYCLMESPELKSGHTFSKDASSPRFELNWTEDSQFEPDHLFHNPYGTWHLEKIG